MANVLNCHWNSSLRRPRQASVHLQAVHTEGNTGTAPAAEEAEEARGQEGDGPSLGEDGGCDLGEQGWKASSCFLYLLIMCTRNIY